MPDARCTRGLVCNVHKKTHTSIQGSGGDPTFPAQWLYGLYRALPGDRACDTVACEYSCQSPVGMAASADLTPALRRQDHATSPYAQRRRQPAVLIAHG